MIVAAVWKQLPHRPSGVKKEGKDPLRIFRMLQRLHLTPPLQTWLLDSFISSFSCKHFIEHLLCLKLTHKKNTSSGALFPYEVEIETH
ncbi:hypothetical protein L2E82_05236 [Cichorium intybus]|uniref:Uncharacterized protein n=1 Tax=Cichorium intybus TaxID=13427 RepID=A0ACB9H7G6_CICIN|nr:hypothetical protein L2E82_05236 [Cichorium intybus]